MRWLLLFWCVTASAAELTPEQAFNSYAIAYGHVGFIPEKPPTIHIVERPVLCRMAGLPDACRARGITNGDGVIYLDKALDFSDPIDASVLIHELVHYIDWAKDGPSYNCEQWMRREYRAYTIQATAIEKIGGDPSQIYMALRSLRCQDPK